MRNYIGTKRIAAEPKQQDGEDGYRVVYSDGYESWSPKGVFETAYQQTDTMSFGNAVEILKGGLKVARAGWNGKNMYLELVGGMSRDGVTYLPFIRMSTAQGDFVPWLASQTDVLVNDWCIV